MEWIIYAIPILAIALFIIIIKLPFWKTDLQKLLILFLSVGIFIGLPASISLIRLEIQPLQTDHVEIIEKRMADKESGSSSDLYYITFKLSDGSQKEWSLKKKIYDEIQENDTGVLFYKQIKDGNKPGQIRVKSFEKNSTLSEYIQPKDSRPFTLFVFILSWSIYIGGLGGWLIWSLRRHKKILSLKGRE